MEENPIPNTQYPPGIRFHPSDEELITYYLQRKVKSLSLPTNVIADIELYNYNPWDLPSKALFGDDEWYFFTPRDKKYPNGGRPNRTTTLGYWKATGTDKPIVSLSGSRTIGVKKALVFYKGKPPTGHKMDWIMTEYRLPESSRPLRSKGCMRLDDWVLCRVQQKGNMSKKAKYDDLNSCKYVEKTEDLPSVCTKNRDILSDYLQSSEYRLIASLLTEHFPVEETIPKTTTKRNNRRVCREITHENVLGKTSEETVSLLQTILNNLPSQSKEENKFIYLPVKMNEDKDVNSLSEYI